MPTTAAQLRAIAAGSESRIREEFLSKQTEQAIRKIREAAAEGYNKCAVQITETKHTFLVPEVIVGIKNEYPDVIITQEPPSVGSARVFVNWELTPSPCGA